MLSERGAYLMKITEYQNQSKKFINKDLSSKERIINMSLGICGEGGEIADIIKKHYFHNHELDVMDLVKEIGDVMWYLTNLASELGIDFKDVLQINYDKLSKRYPNGFNSEDSKKRIDTK